MKKVDNFFRKFDYINVILWTKTWNEDDDMIGIISFLQEQEDDDDDEFVMLLNTVQVDLIIFSNFSSFKLFMNLHSFV